MYEPALFMISKQLASLYVSLFQNMYDPADLKNSLVLYMDTSQHIPYEIVNIVYNPEEECTSVVKPTGRRLTTTCGTADSTEYM